MFCVSGRWTAVLSDLWGVLAADVWQLYRNTSASVHLLLWTCWCFMDLRRQQVMDERSCLNFNERSAEYIIESLKLLTIWSGWEWKGFFWLSFLQSAWWCGHSPLTQSKKQPTKQVKVKKSSKEANLRVKLWVVFMKEIVSYPCRDYPRQIVCIWAQVIMISADLEGLKVIFYSKTHLYLWCQFI